MTKFRPCLSKRPPRGYSIPTVAKFPPAARVDASFVAFLSALTLGFVGGVWPTGIFGVSLTRRTKLEPPLTRRCIRPDLFPNLHLEIRTDANNPYSAPC